MDIPLSAAGRDEAAAAAALLARTEAPTAVWSSPLSRAVYGAARVCEACGVRGGARAVVEDAGFTEVARGDWVGLTEAEIGAGAFSRWNSDPSFAPPGGGEALAELAKRVLAAKDARLVASPWGSTTVLVSHMWVTRSLVAQSLGLLDTAMRDTSALQGLDIPTASVSVLEYLRAGGPSLAAASAEAAAGRSAWAGDGGDVGGARVRFVGYKPPALSASAGDAWGG